MAGRLLARYARLLCRASSAQPHAANAAATWSWSSRRQLCEGEAMPRRDAPRNMPPRSRLDELAEKAAAPDDILQAWAEHGGNANQAAGALVRWTKLTLKTRGRFGDASDAAADPRLAEMKDAVTRQVSSVWNGALVSVLRALWAMGVPEDDPVIGSVRTEVMWRLRRLTYKQLGFLVNWGAGRRAPQDAAIVGAALKQLELRWTEISDAKTVSALMAKGRHMSPALMDRLEDKALELAESFSAEEIRQVFLSLAVQGRRSVPLLRALSYHFLQRPSSELSTPLLLDLAFTYGKLNFQQSQVFQRIASELLPRVPELTAVDVTRCAKSLGYLKWLHIPLFEAFADHYMENSRTYSRLQLGNLLMTFARLGFQPSKRDDFFGQVHAVIDAALAGLEPFLRTDVAWSLCVLQQARPEHLLPLTQQQHLDQLSDGGPSRVENYRLKLLHIATTLHLEHPGFLEAEAFPLHLATLGLQGSSPPTPLQSSLREALLSLVGGRVEALRTGVVTLYGWSIEGELVLDSDNQPLDLSALRAPHLASGGEGQELPADARRVAFLAWEFPNFGSKSKDLLGRFTMMRRHLQLAGFITVEVPYYEWMELKSDRQRVAYLRDKIGKAVAEDLAK